MVLGQPPGGREGGEEREKGRGRKGRSGRVK